MKKLISIFISILFIIVIVIQQFKIKQLEEYELRWEDPNSLVDKDGKLFLKRLSADPQKWEIIINVQKYNDSTKKWQTYKREKTILVPIENRPDISK